MKNYKTKTNYLIIVEGQSLEVKLFKSIFTSISDNYSFKQYINGAKIEDGEIIADEEDYKFVYIVKPKRNTLSKIVKDINALGVDSYYYQTLFDDCFEEGFFRKIFYVFDLDYTSNVDLNTAKNYFCDENDQGLLLVSSPCIEACCDFNETSYMFERKTGASIHNTYKPKVRKIISSNFAFHNYNNSTTTFLCSNCFTIMRHCLHKNNIHYGSNHLVEVIDKFYDLHGPSKTGSTIIYPMVTSFFYILVGLIYSIDTSNNPTKELDSFLKRFATMDKDSNRIMCISNYL